MVQFIRSHNVFNRKGVFQHVATISTDFATRAEAELRASRVAWLNENRTAQGKYFDIKIDGVEIQPTADMFRATLTK